MMTFQNIAVEREGRLAKVILNRPEVRNAFNELTIAELTAVFATLGNDAETRAIVLSGRGLSFCAGADLNWMKKMADYSHAENLADAGQLATMLSTIYTCPKPVVARLQGDCYAGGMGLVAACDIVIASDKVNFCLSEVKLGLIPATISPYVIKAMGEQAARRYFLSAEKFSASDAARMGLVHELVSEEELDAKVAQIVHTLLSNSPHAVMQAKRLVRAVGGQEISAALIASTVKDIAEIRASEEGREGVRSFLEKRKPSWLQA